MTPDFTGFLLGLFFYPKDGGKMLLQNVGLSKLHGITTELIEIFILTAGRASYPNCSQHRCYKTVLAYMDNLREHTSKNFHRRVDRRKTLITATSENCSGTKERSFAPLRAKSASTNLI
jgi:hypothetical protein